jgi:hypothetical protein
MTLTFFEYMCSLSDPGLPVVPNDTYEKSLWTVFSDTDEGDLVPVKFSINLSHVHLCVNPSPAKATPRVPAITGNFISWGSSIPLQPVNTNPDPSAAVVDLHRADAEELIDTCPLWQISLRLPVGAKLYFVFELDGLQFLSSEHPIVQHSNLFNADAGGRLLTNSATVAAENLWVARDPSGGRANSSTAGMLSPAASIKSPLSYLSPSRTAKGTFALPTSPGNARVMSAAQRERAAAAPETTAAGAGSSGDGMVKPTPVVAFDLPTAIHRASRLVLGPQFDPSRMLFSAIVFPPLPAPIPTPFTAEAATAVTVLPSAEQPPVLEVLKKHYVALCEKYVLYVCKGYKFDRKGPTLAPQLSSEMFTKFWNDTLLFRTATSFAANGTPLAPNLTVAQQATVMVLSCVAACFLFIFCHLLLLVFYFFV